MLYIGDKGANVAARPSESSPAETGGLSASNLPLVSIPHPARMPDGPAKAGEVFIRQIDMFMFIRIPYGRVQPPPQKKPQQKTKTKQNEKNVIKKPLKTTTQKM